MHSKYLAAFLLTAFCALAPRSNGQPASPEPAAVRVTVSMNPDGSRTAYEFDSANHKATATTTGKDQKVREKIHYLLDEGGRFASGKVFGANGKLRFKTLYSYDANGRLLQETQLGANDVAQHKIVYSYDGSGKQIGYSVLDASGNVLSQTKAPDRAQVTKAHDR